jgi:hypothetical protein
LNVLFQSTLPLPHILYAQISQAKAKLMHMVGEEGTRNALIPLTLWKDLTKKYTDEHPIGANTTARKKKKPFDYTVIYTYYRELLQMPDTKPWAFFTLFILVFPTGNAISERGFSAMGASNSKQRSEMSHDQVFAHMIIGFNGPSTTEFATKITAASKIAGGTRHG